MSSMTAGVNRKFCPRMRLLRAEGVSSRARGAAMTSFSKGIVVSSGSEHELLLGRFEIVVVPELFAGDDLAHIGDAARGIEPVHVQFAREPRFVGFPQLGVH